MSKTVSDGQELPDGAYTCTSFLELNIHRNAFPVAIRVKINTFTTLYPSCYGSAKG